MRGEGRGEPARQSQYALAVSAGPHGSEEQETLFVTMWRHSCKRREERTKRERL
jgi:hypothetical protein